ncbi:hypothetical protein HPB52_006514 [Rhipicephalus sanguineus]|uniref:Tick transposon n=1 Tax=Rhipicephalus sanguineus TaxID=34632 RepID=A0A9D4PV33_RHISA|nr:hypothetical protein HPB52_006514 [Rhipicephalus sanguineus]
MALGIHNTFSEIAEAQNVAQLARLSPTEADGQPLTRLNLTSTFSNKRERTLPHSIRDRILVPPLPRNMHQDYNQGRRKALAVALLKTAASMPYSVAFVDAAKYPNISTM